MGVMGVMVLVTVVLVFVLKLRYIANISDVVTMRIELDLLTTICGRTKLRNVGCVSNSRADTCPHARLEVKVDSFAYGSERSSANAADFLLNV